MSIFTDKIAILLLLGIAILALAGCVENPNREYGNKGDILEVGAYYPEMLNDVVFTTNGKNYLISPQRDGEIIAAVKARAVNLKSTQVSLSIDESAVKLRTKDGLEFHALNVSSVRVETSSQVTDDNKYGTYAWGSVALKKGFEIAGWFFFSVPSGTEFFDFVWDDVEFVKVQYPKWD